MKLTNLQKYLLFFLISILLFSCKEDESVGLLQKAQSSLAENKPDIALNIISSIQNPQSMDEYNYMQYIVTYFGAKYETGQDIKGDSLIIEAQQYFNKKEKSEESALANFYAAQLYDVNANYPKALESYMHAVANAQKLNNNLLAGRSLNNIGYIYYQQELFDDAILNYQSALSSYNKVENEDQRKLKALTNIGRTYRLYNKYDSAYVYFNRVLEDATKSGNKEYISHSLQNLGVISSEMGKFDKALDYIHSALAMDVTGKPEIRQMHLSLLKTYTWSGDLKSAKQYADSVIIDLPQVTYKFTILDMYAALADYYRQTGDYQKSMDYKYLQASTNKQIDDNEINVPAILEADKNFHLEQKDSDFFEFKSDAILFGIIAIVIIVALLVLGFFMYRTHKKDEEEINSEIDKYNHMRQILRDQSKEYDAIEAELKAMREDKD